MNLGETIYKYRTLKNLSQGDLADMLDVSRQSVSKWENNSATPDLDKILKLCEIYGITIDELVKGEERVARTPEDPLIEPKQAETLKYQTGFTGRKVAGTILLCMAFISILFLSMLGGFGVGLSVAIPFTVCGVICFAFKQNTGLWCAWAIYFMIDFYLRGMTGTNRGLIFNAYYYASPNGTMLKALLVSWVLNLALIFLAVITMLRFKNKPLEMNRKKRNLFIAGIVALLVIKAFEMILPATVFYDKIRVIDHVHIHVIIYMITDWIKIIISLLLIVNFARYRLKTALLVAFSIVILSFGIHVVSNIGITDALNTESSSHQVKLETMTKDKSIYEHGMDIVSMLAELTNSNEYVQAFSGSEEILNVIKDIGAGDYTAPQTVYRITLDMDNVLKTNEMLDLDHASEALITNLKNRVLASIITGINSRGGVTNLAATSVCTTGKTFVSNEIHEEMIYLYTYSDAVPVAVSFTLGEDNTVSASGSFLLYDEIPAGSVQELLEYFGAYSVEIEVMTE